MNGIGNIQMLDINQMQGMSIDEMVGLYRQGYRLLSNSSINIGIKSLAICPTSPITKGAAKNVKVEVTTPGTPPYTFKVKKAGTEILTYIGGATETSKIWPYTFNDIGTFDMSGYAIDSCPTGPKTSAEDTCTVTVQEVPPTGVSPIAILLGLGLLGYVMIR